MTRTVVIGKADEEIKQKILTEGISAIMLGIGAIMQEPEYDFPLDAEAEARTVQAYIAAGLPKRFAYAQLSEVDDVEYIMDLQKQEQEDAMAMYEGMQGMMQAEEEPEENQEEKE